MNAPTVQAVTLADDSVALAVGAGETIYTKTQDMSNLDTFAVTYIAACTGLPNVKIEIEQAIVLPTTEGAADANYVVPETIADIESGLVDKNLHIANLPLICVRYGRFKITELSGVTADTVLTMNLSAQNRFRQ